MSLQAKGQSFRNLLESASKRVEERAPRVAVWMQEAMRATKDKVADLLPDDFSIKEIYEACHSTSIREAAVDPTAFTVLTGELVSKKAMDAYLAGSKVGDSLTTKYRSTQEVDRVPGAYALGTLEDLNAGQPYPELGDVKEKYVTLDHAKRGLILNITEEAIKFDQTGLVLKRAADFGEILAADREKKIVNTILDLTGYKSYYPSGTQADLWAGGYANRITNNLQDFTDIDAAKVILSAMTNENGDPITVNARGPNISMLVPMAKGTTAMRLKGPIMPGVANQEANPYAGAYTVIETPLMDIQSAIIWLYGNFKKQYLLKEVIPMEVLRPKKGNMNQWTRDIITSFKIRHDVTCGATDWRYVCWSSGAVT